MANIDSGVMLGALGSSARISGGSLAPPKGMVIAAIQFVGQATLEDAQAEDNDKFLNTDHPANSLTAGQETGASSETKAEGSGGEALGAGISFPAGMTIYGRWTSIQVSTPADDGCVIAYFGY